MKSAQLVVYDIARTKSIVIAGFIFALLFLLTPAMAEVPSAIAVPGEALVTTFHAQGAQVYDCIANAVGGFTWQFREPIATLIVNGKTVGRHYAGPTWELVDGSAVVGKVAGQAPGATQKDIALVKLDVVSQRGSALAEISTIQRLNTKGGVVEGPCDPAVAFLSVPYSADYAFYTKARWSLIPNAAPNSVPYDRFSDDPH